MTHRVQTRGRGDKRSSHLIHRRRLYLVRRLVRGPADGPTLIDDANAAFPDVPEGVYPADALAALRHDLTALRQEYGCDIQRANDGRYTLLSPGDLALLDLPDGEMEAMAFLASVYGDHGIPNAGQIAAFLQRVASLMPRARRDQMRTISAQPRVDRPQAEHAVAEIFKQLKRMVGKRIIEFAYQSPHTPDGAAARHQVAPIELFYREGHTYLDTFCLKSDIPGLADDFVLYRLDRIVPNSLNPLPGSPKRAYHRPPYLLRYWLAPAVARRRDVAHWFPQTVISYADDGSAEVMATATDLWRAQQILMRYREHCRVLEPPQLATMMRESARRMVALYEHPDVAGPDGGSP
ncbi:MAG: WYL domain-containing protein [Chloroflexi bacterium]|nr:WYL domain-containing protein [Chloroflexota bacterium]